MFSRWRSVIDIDGFFASLEFGLTLPVTGLSRLDFPALFVAPAP